MKLISSSGVVVNVSDSKGAELLKSGGFTLPVQEKKAPVKKATRRKTTTKKAAPVKETATE